MNRTENPRMLVSVDYHAHADCRGGSCPTVYEDGPDYFIIQGRDAANRISHVSMPDNELAVKIPKYLLQRLVENGEL